jgi:hypothetical protein
MSTSAFERQSIATSCPPAHSHQRGTQERGRRVGPKPVGIVCARVARRRARRRSAARAAARAAVPAAVLAVEFAAKASEVDAAGDIEAASEADATREEEGCDEDEHDEDPARASRGGRVCVRRRVVAAKPSLV